MPTTGWFNPTTGADDSSTGTVTWASPGNATSSDDVWATITGFASGTTVKDKSLKLVKAGTIGGTDNADTTTIWPTPTDGTKIYGSSSDLWGTTWTYDDIANTSFGVVLSAQTDTAVISHYLKCTDYSGIRTSGMKSNDVINGIEVQVERHYDSGIACFTGDTLIKVPGNFKKMQDIIIGDEVISFDENRKTTIDRVTDKIERKRKTLIINAGVKVTTTDDHQFLTDNGFVKAGELKKGDRIWHQDGLRRISSIVNGKEQTVYDISVEKNKTFIANGFYVHNFIIISLLTAYVDVIQVRITWTPGPTNFIPILM